MHGNDFASLFSAVFSKIGLFSLWATFLAGAILRWVAHARVRAQVRFLAAYDHSLLTLKDTPSLSKSQLREKSESSFRSYYSTGAGQRLLRSVDRFLGGEATSWQIIDRVVNLAFDKRGGAAQERARYVLSSTQSMTRFFKIFSLGAFHRLGAATPALLVLLGAMGTYTGFLTALPELNPRDIADTAALSSTLAAVLARMGVHTGYAILGTLLAAAAIVVNAIWDAERTFQAATNRLAHVVEFLESIEHSGTVTGLTEATESAEGAKLRGQRNYRATASLPQANEIEENTNLETAPEVPGNLATSYATPAAAESPTTRRPRAEVMKAEADWGPLPPSAVPSRRQKPIRVEAAEAPKLEDSFPSDDDLVLSHAAPEISQQVGETPHAQEPVRAPRSAVSTPLPIAVPDPLPPFEEQVPLPPVPEKFPGQDEVRSDFQFPDTALPTDWDEQIRGLKTQLNAMEQNPNQPVSPMAPEYPAPEVPFDEIQEKTIVGTPQLLTALPAPTELESPTEAELIAMMVPKEWATQRPADHLPHVSALDHDINEAPVRPELRAVPAPVNPVSSPRVEQATPVLSPRPAAVVEAPAAKGLSAADQDRLAILGHRMDKISLYLSKAGEDLKEEIISQEMFDDETNRWRHEIDTLNKEISALTAKIAA